ncbi:Protein HID1 [Eumeta japonica]|uniref:Protein HID1 n=1 Tax=Eumeta variegata TaxID=151549 RepID=A0A4C1YYC7_EUMVA|nr:Protein HID1 [Eumeta japonica]
MGNADTKLNFRKAVVQLTSKTQPIDSSDDSFWDQFWSENVTNVQDVFALVPGAEIRALREESPTNLATLVYKAVEKMVKIVDNSCRTQREQQTALNCARLLTRVLPYMFEEPEWHGFFWSSLPAASENESVPLAQSLINAICDLLFCPDFTVTSTKRMGPERAEELSSLDSCEYIWAAGVGFARSPPRYAPQEAARSELLRLLLTCFSETIYKPPPPADQPASPTHHHNKWIAYLTSPENRHALPLFTSLLNTVCSYDPVGLGLPYNHLLFSDTLEPLVEVALQILIVTLDHDTNGALMSDSEEKFMYYVLKSSDVLDVLVPILYHLNDSRADQSRVGLMHIGVFILLLLSGERNLGVRLNKPYAAAVPMDIPVFTGTHADLLVVVFHKIITTGHQRLQPLFDCLLTILVNVSPYLKTLSMVASTKLLHLLEAFSTPWFLFSHPHHHHLVFFLLEIFNNIIQYQFDGNSNLVYTIIRKRSVFHNLANLPHEHGAIARSLAAGKRVPRPPDAAPDTPMEGSRPAQPAEPGTLNPTLPDTPGVNEHTSHQSTGAALGHSRLRKSHQCVVGLLGKNRMSDGVEWANAIGSMTERESAHPTGSRSEGGITETAVESREQLLSAQRPSGDGEDTNGDPDDDEDAHTKTTDKEAPVTPPTVTHRDSIRVGSKAENAARAMGAGLGGEAGEWRPTAEWVSSWRSKLPLQTIMRLLQVLVPQVEKICIDKGLTDESEILRFLQHGTLVGLLPVPHPILIRKYQANAGTAAWFRTYMWGVIYIRNVDPPIWYDTDVKLFEIQRV